MVASGQQRQAELLQGQPGGQALGSAPHQSTGEACQRRLHQRGGRKLFPEAWAGHASRLLARVGLIGRMVQTPSLAAAAIPCYPLVLLVEPLAHRLALHQCQRQAQPAPVPISRCPPRPSTHRKPLGPNSCYCCNNCPRRRCTSRGRTVSRGATRRCRACRPARACSHSRSARAWESGVHESGRAGSAARQPSAPAATRQHRQGPKKGRGGSL